VIAAEARGDPLPEKVLVAMNILPICAPYRKAWEILDVSRPWVASVTGAVPVGIPYSEMSVYAHDNGFADTQSDLEDFVRLVRAQDAVWRKWFANQTKRK